MGRLVIWLSFLGILFFVEAKFIRHIFLDISKERIIKQTEPLIKAIDQYQMDFGVYPRQLESLIPQYIENLSSLPGDYNTYKDLDSTYQLSFRQWVGGRTYRVVVYNPTETFVVPEYATSFDVPSFHDTDLEKWKYFDY